jgi:hypothetical protein
MTLRRLLLIGLGLSCILGCRAAPFAEPDLVSVDELDPQAVRDQFSLELPVKFRVVNTVTFQFRGRSFTALGYTEVDTSTETFTVVGLHPAGGFKLFELSGDAEDVECTFALEELSRRGEFAQAVGNDTRRMYFDRIPAPDARISKGKHRIFFRQHTADGEMEYVFAGVRGVLVEKRYYENGRKVWSASYYEYLRKNGRLYPSGIILKHHEYGYQLVVRLKEIWS